MSSLRANRAALRAILRAPAPLFGPAPRNDEGEALDAQLHRMLRVMALRARDPEQITVPRHRGEFRAGMRLLGLPSRRLAKVEERSIPGPAGPLPARLYLPYEADRLPLLVYFHGGGFVIGDLDTHDTSCQHLAAEVGCAVLAVDYRLAPEHPFPAAVEDAEAAARWAIEHAEELGADPRRVAVGGDSAGGNLSIAATLGLRERPARAPLCFQLLIYPSTDASLSMPSHRLFSEGFFLSEPMIRFFFGHYNPDANDIRASPLFAPDLSGLPPALVITAGFDPLRDEGRAYAERLADSGVPVEHRCYRSLVHAFFEMGGVIDSARLARADAVSALRRAFFEQGASFERAIVAP